jgi:hypothetical protein
MERRLSQVRDFLRELFVWQLFFVMGVYYTITQLEKFVVEGDVKDVLHLYFSAAIIVFALWLRKKEITDGRAFRGIPRWFDWVFAAIHAPLGVILMHQGENKGIMLVGGAFLVFVASFFRTEGGGDGGGGGDGPKDDDPKPPGQKLPLDWLLKRKRIVRPPHVSSN